MITYSYSSRKIVQENVCFYGTILNLVTKVVQTPPKSDNFLLYMQTRECHPYIYAKVQREGGALFVFSDIGILKRTCVSGGTHEPLCCLDIKQHGILNIKFIQVYKIEKQDILTPKLYSLQTVWKRLKSSQF